MVLSQQLKAYFIRLRAIEQIQIISIHWFVLNPLTSVDKRFQYFKKSILFLFLWIFLEYV